MAQQIIDVGAAPDDGNGDPLRTAFQKCNSNFTELYGNAIVLKTTAIAVGSLPNASTAGSGARAFVNDANTVTFYANVGSGGSNSVPVFSDGTSWRVG